MINVDAMLSAGPAGPQVGISYSSAAAPLHVYMATS